jgi:hypothetical protein
VTRIQCLTVWQSLFYAGTITVYTPLRIQDQVPQAVSNEAGAKCLNTVREIARLCRTYQRQYGNSHMNIHMVQAIHTALMVLFESEPGAYEQDLIDLCIFMWASGPRFAFPLAVFRIFQGYVQQSGRKLPPQIEKLFEQFEAVD